MCEKMILKKPRAEYQSAVFLATFYILDQKRFTDHIPSRAVRSLCDQPVQNMAGRAWHGLSHLNAEESHSRPLAPGT